MNTKPLAPTTNVTRPDSIQSSGLYNYWANMSATGRAGGVLLGKLAMEGEPLPWTPMLVVVECKGAVVNATQSDPQGQFVISYVNERPEAEQQPADAQRQMQREYEGCLVKTALAGFRSTPVMITVRHLRDDPNLGTITLSAEGRDGGTELSATSRSAPPDALKAFEKARADWLDQNVDGARHNLGKAVKIYPGFAEAWLQLGKLLEEGDPQRARAFFQTALAADPKFVLPYEQLAKMAAYEKKWAETIENTARALSLDPQGTPQLWYCDALAKFYLGKTEAARESAAKGLTIDPRHSVAGMEQLLAVILARQANYKEALEHLRNCLTYTLAGRDVLKEQIAQLEKKTAAAK
jgi:tetratricopeptide (TPR) repeat protein